MNNSKQEEVISALVARHPVPQIEQWADMYEREGGHALIVQMLRSYAALTAQQQEPVAWMHYDKDGAHFPSLYDWNNPRIGYTVRPMYFRGDMPAILCRHPGDAHQSPSPESRDEVVVPSKMTLMNAAFALVCPEEVPKEKRMAIAQKLLVAAKESEQTHVRVPVDKLTISDCYRFGIDISSIRSTATGKESEHGK